MRQYVIYLGVYSSGQASCGFDMQERDIELFLASFAPRPWQVIGRFKDALVEPGRGGPQLKAAINLVRRTSAAELLVSALDVIDHGEGFVASLRRDPKVRLRAVTMWRAAPTQLRIYSAIAKHDPWITATPDDTAHLGAISERTNPDNSLKLVASRSATNPAGKHEVYAYHEMLITSLRDQGLSYRAIARHLNAAEIRTSREAMWVGPQVRRVLRRVQARELQTETIQCSAASPSVDHDGSDSGLLETASLANSA